MKRKTATNTLTKCVRSSITAPDDAVFVAADWAGIELRVLTWFARDKAGLDRIIEMGSSQLYLDMAAKVYGREIKKSDTFEYTVGKAGRLGCGYGMGPYSRTFGKDGKFKPNLDEYGRLHGGFVEYARNYGIEITPATAELAEKVVKVYRKENKKVVDLWDACHKAAIETVETGYPVEVNGCKFSVRKVGKSRSMVIRLLSGRELFYPAVGIEERNGRKSLYYWTDKNKKWVRTHLYGGLIVENIIQAMSRDLLMPAMIAVSKRYPIVSHCYDEIVCEVPPAVADECMEYMDKCMCVKLPWAKGLPLETEGWIGKRYKK
jgi:DNA polymerase